MCIITSVHFGIGLFVYQLHPCVQDLHLHDAKNHMLPPYVLAYIYKSENYAYDRAQNAFANAVESQFFGVLIIALLVFANDHRHGRTGANRAI